MDLASAFTNRATVLEETFTTSGTTKEYLSAPAMAAGGHVALCWNRHLLYNGANSPTTYRALVDMDLFVYDGSSGALLGSSTSALDSVERVTLAAACSNPILKVVRSGSFPSGQTSVGWALATDAGSAATPTTVSLPSLSCSLAVGASLVGAGQDFSVQATVTNAGSVAAAGTAVTLTFPADYTVVSGANPRILSTVGAGGGKATATWTVRSGSVGAGSGTRSFSARASVSSFGDTVTSGVATASQMLDADLPTLGLFLQGSAEAAKDPAVTLLVQAQDATSAVPEMRLRNAGDAWGPWVALASPVPWNLAPGEGTRTVEVEVRDAVGNESLPATASLFVDHTAPVGSFVLSQDREYLIPGKEVRMELTALDPGGSGVRGFRWRAAGAEGWSDWIPTGGVASLPFARPAGEVLLSLEVQFDDAAGNLSGVTGDSIRILREDDPSMDAAKSFSGVLAPAGDIDSLRFGAMEGDEISVTVSAKVPKESKGTEVALDLWDPSGEPVVLGRYPADAKRPGVKAFPAAATGSYTLVLRATGPVAEPGIRYRVGLKVARSKDALRVEGSGKVAYSQHLEIPFPGVAGMELSGSVGAGSGTRSFSARASVWLPALQGGDPRRGNGDVHPAGVRLRDGDRGPPPQAPEAGQAQGDGGLRRPRRRSPAGPPPAGYCPAGSDEPCRNSTSSERILRSQ